MKRPKTGEQVRRERERDPWQRGGLLASKKKGGLFFSRALKTSSPTPPTSTALQGVLLRRPRTRGARHHRGARDVQEGGEGRRLRLR